MEVKRHGEGDMDTGRIDNYDGLRRELEIGLRIAPSRATAGAVAGIIANYLDADTHVAVRLAGLANDSSRVLITLAVCLGTVDEIKTSDATSKSALALIQRIVDHLSACDPAFVSLPDKSSAESRLAAHVTACPSSGAVDVTTAITRLALAA
jgi:hypothetical protein